MAQPRKHHYLPQFYLRGFSENGKSIYQIEKPGMRAYMCAIHDAAAIRDYHILDNPDNETPQELEKVLSQIETRHADALSQVVQSGITSDKLHTCMIEFVSLMRFRVPAIKDFIEASLRETVRSAGKLMERQGAFPPPPKGLEDVFRLDQVKIEISNWKCLERMFALAAEPRLLEMLASMKPSVYQVPEGMFLMTCDQPVALYHPTAAPGDAYGVGLADNALQITLPLSSGVLLYLSRTDERPTNTILNPDEVNEFNRRTVIMADSLIFAPSPSEYALEISKRFGRYSAGPDLNVLEYDHGALHVTRLRPIMAADRYRQQH